MNGILEQKEALDREFRIKTKLAIMEKKKDLFNKLAKLEKLEKEYDQFENPEWFTSVSYMSEVNDI